MLLSPEVRKNIESSPEVWSIIESSPEVRKKIPKSGSRLDFEVKSGSPEKTGSQVRVCG